MLNNYKHQVFIVISILLSFVLFAVNPLQLDVKAAKVLAIAFLVIFLWITEAIPMAASALLPLILFPLLNIMPVKEVAKSYGDPIIFLFMGGFFLGLL